MANKVTLGTQALLAACEGDQGEQDRFTEYATWNCPTCHAGHLASLDTANCPHRREAKLTFEEVTTPQFQFP